MRQLVWLGGRFCTAVAVFSMGLVVALLLAAAPALGETEEPAADAEEPVLDARRLVGTADRVRRTTITPFSVEVRGRPFDNFSNEDAAGTIKDWLTDVLNEVPVFNIVSREDIDSVLTEQSLGETERVEDVSPQIVAEAGRLAKVNYLLYGRITNFDETSELNFYLLDVETAQMPSGPLRQQIELTFNGSLKSIKSSLSRIVGNLAAQFPLETDLAEVVGRGVVDLAAGYHDGIDEDMEVTIVHRGTDETVARGYVVSTTAATSRVSLEDEAAVIDLIHDVARVKIVPPAQAALHRGRRYFANGDYQKALLAFDRGLAADPEDEELHAGKARAHYRLGQTEEALASFSKAQVYGAGDSALLEDSIKASFEAGRYLDIIATLSKQELGRLSGQIGNFLGMAYDLVGRVNEARDTYRAVARFHPNQPDVPLRLAIHALNDDDRPEAERKLRNAVDLGRDSSEVQIAFAVYQGDDAPVQTAEREGDFAALATASEVLLAAEPERWADAVSYARESRSINPNYVRARMLEVRAIDVGGRPEEAAELLVEAREQFPDNFALTWYAAELLARTEEYGQAVAVLEEAARLAPDDPRPHELMGDVLERQGQHGSAVGAYKAALELVVESESAELLYKQGRSEALRQQYVQAMEPLKRCTRIVADKSECYFYLAVSEFHTGQHADAFTHFQAADEFDDRHYYVAKIHQDESRVKEATAALNACVGSESQFADECHDRLQRIESITATVIDETGSGSELIVELDVGSNHGVDHGMKARVLDFKKTWIEITQVNKTTSKGRVANPEKKVSFQGRDVQFRPNRPQGLVAQAGTKKGVKLTWKANAMDEEVAAYVVFRANGSSSDGEELKRIKAGQNAAVTFEDKSARFGEEYYYWIVAENVYDQRSLHSEHEYIEVTR